MKRLLAIVLSGCLALGIAGCSSAPDEGTPSVSSTVPTQDTTQASVVDPLPTVPQDSDSSMHAVVLPKVTEPVTAEDGTTLFSLSFHSLQLLMEDPAVSGKIVSDLQQRTAPILANASHMEEQARADYPGSELWSEYFIDLSYAPTRLDSAVLSLFGNFTSYSGGPHPSLLTDSVTYDLQTGNVVHLDEILKPECSDDALYQLIVKSLSSQEEMLYYDYADALRDRFTGELRSIVDWYFSRKGLCFHFAPYDIAPYSSGTIIAELPYSDLSEVLLDKYLPAELPDTTGSMYAETFIEDDSERFSTIAHVLLYEEGTDILLYPDAAVTDVRLEIGSRYYDTNQYIATSTVFAADYMNVGDAVRICADFQDESSLLRLVYHSGGQEYSAFISYDADGDSILLTHG